MGAIKGTAERRRRSTLVSIRMTVEEHGVLASAAGCAGMPVTRLARIVLQFGLGELLRGNPEIDRTIKDSRD
jgi:hypothetical protein